MTKAKVFNVFCEVYGVNLLVILGMEASKVKPFLEKKYNVKYDYTDNLQAGALLQFNTYPYQVLWLSKLSKEDLIPKLGHEIFHHVLRVCKQKQIPTYPEKDNLVMDEPAAYLMEYYLREIIKKI